MSWTDEDRRDIRRDTRFLGGLSIGWTVIIVIVVLALIAAIWGISVAVSGPKGQGDALREKNSAENWTKAQKEFHQRYESIKAADKTIVLYHKTMVADPTDSVAKQNYTGAVAGCNSAVADYNTLAESYLAEQFRDADLPSRIDDNDPATDCKE